MNFTIDPNATAHPEDLQFNGNSRTPSSSRPRKKWSTIILMIGFFFLLTCFIGGWVASRSYHLRRQLQVEVPANAKLYPSGADMEMVEGPDGTTSFYFYEVAIRFRFTGDALNDYSEIFHNAFYRGVKFPMKLDADGFYHLKDGRTIWLITDKSGTRYQMIIP